MVYNNRLNTYFYFEQYDIKRIQFGNYANIIDWCNGEILKNLKNKIIKIWV